MQLCGQAINGAMHPTLHADGDGVHGDMGTTDLCKLLDAIDNDNIVVRIAHHKVLIVG